MITKIIDENSVSCIPEDSDDLIILRRIIKKGDKIIFTTRKHLIVSTPYRISLGGGGTDLPFYASQRKGFLITAAIDEYLTVLVAKRTLDKKILLQYTQTEMVDSVEQINHKILKYLFYFELLLQ